MKITEIKASDLVRTSMEAYAKEVIEDRALPDLRDGLKPSQRRILYYMASENLMSNSHFKTSAAIVGGVLGKFHPHGDISIYGTLVGLNNHTISPVNGDGDGWGSAFTEASAMRYTKTKMSKFGERFCEDLHVADFTPNYSGDSEEPIIIPAPLPFALLAGTNGIAVAVATCIPAHNLKELVNTFVSILYGEQDLDKLIGKVLFGPESKTGGVLISTLDEITDMYRNGKGKLKWRCGYSLSCSKGEEWILIVDSIPECFALNSWLEKMKAQAENGTLRIENESCSSDPIRFSIRFNNASVFEEIIEPSLYCYENYNFNLILRSENLQDTELQHHNFLSWADAWLTWREDVEIKIVNAQIKKLEKELLREGVKLWAVSRIDEIIVLLKKSMIPLMDLMKTFKLSEEQAKIVAEMQLQSISKLSKEKQEQTLKRLNEGIQTEKEKLKTPKALVEMTLQSLLPYSKPRIAKIDYGNEKGEPSRKALKKFEGKPTYWAVEQKNPKYLINLGSEIPLRKRAINTYIGIIDATKGMITVSDKGVITHLKLQKLVEGDLGNPIVGIASMNAKYFSISVNNGLIADYSTEQSVSQWTSKLLTDGEDKVLSVAFYNDKDVLLTYSDDEISSTQIKNWAPMLRSNKSGKKAFKSLRGRKDVYLKTIPYGYSIYFPKLKKCLSFAEISKPTKEVKGLLLKEPYFLYNDDIEMYCVATDGCRFLLKGEQVFSQDIVETYIV